MEITRERALNGLRLWLSATNLKIEEQAQTFIFLGVGATAARLSTGWLSTAPAHPEQLNGWLLTRLTKAARRVDNQADQRTLDVNLASLAKLAAPVTAVLAVVATAIKASAKSYHRVKEIRGDFVDSDVMKAESNFAQQDQ